MRIIAGKYKGHRLVDFSADHIRPTTDRVKETLFNKLMGWTEGARVLDLFSGTGNLGLEALSRGAVHVDFVEQNPKSLSILKQNIAKLKVKEGFHVHAADVFQFLKRFGGDPYDIVLVDPPFTQKIADAAMVAISEAEICGPRGFLAIESSAFEVIRDEYGALIILDRKKFGDKTFSFFQSRSS